MLDLAKGFNQEGGDGYGCLISYDAEAIRSLIAGEEKPKGSE